MAIDLSKVKSPIAGLAPLDPDDKIVHDTGKKVLEIQVDCIEPNPYQPRKYFDIEQITQLAHSIDQNGLLQPITVQIVDEDEPRYQLVAGEQRLRAVKSLGRTHIEAIVVQFDRVLNAKLALIENIKRVDLQNFELSNAIVALQDVMIAEGLEATPADLANALGLNRAHVYRYLAYQDLPSSAKDVLRQNPNLLGPSACYDFVKAWREASQNHTQEQLVQIEQRLLEALEMLAQGELSQQDLADYAFVDLSLSPTSDDTPAVDVVSPTLKAKTCLREIRHGSKTIGKVQKKGTKVLIELPFDVYQEHLESSLSGFLDAMEQFLNQVDDSDATADEYL